MEFIYNRTKGIAFHRFGEVYVSFCGQTFALSEVGDFEFVARVLAVINY